MVKWNSIDKTSGSSNKSSQSNKNSSSKTCSHKGCDKPVDVRVKFKNPMEVIKYCRRHGEWHRHSNDKSKWLKDEDNP